MGQKLEILKDYFVEEKGIKTIARERDIAKNTVKKYIREFIHAKGELLGNYINNPELKYQLIEEMVGIPTYDVGSRKSRMLLEEHKNFINECLASNEEKRAKGQRKLCMAGVDIYEVLVSEKNYSGSYSPVIRYIQKFDSKKKEAFIKQVYDYGEVFQFDWGNIPFVIEGKNTNLKIAVFTLPKSNLRFAYLYRYENTRAFVDAHVKFFNFIGGVPKLGVYDNMKVAVARFVGKNEKEPTLAMQQLSIYYGFDFRFCNAYSGNEKGSVENAVEFVRRKAFCRSNEFVTIDDAGNQLYETLLKLNDNKVTKEQTANEIFKIEKKYLLPLMPDYSNKEVKATKVDPKWSVINYATNKYSVPDYLCGKIVELHIYIDKIAIVYNQKQVCSHRLCEHENGGRWILDINHYRETLLRKPGAIRNSLAFRVLQDKLKDIFDDYFEDCPKDFILFLDLLSSQSFERLSGVINELKLKGIKVNLDNIKMIVYRAEDCIKPYNANDEILKHAKEELSKYSLLSLGGQI